MSLDNKKFRNNKTGEVVKVISTFENIAILENKQKTTVGELLNPSIFTEEIDPSSFFSNQSAYNILAEKIKTIPTHMIKDDEGSNSIDVTPTYNSESQFSPNINESAVVMTTEEDERAELARKYGVSEDPTQSLQKQNEAFARILGDESENELPQVFNQMVNEPVQRVEVRREEVDSQPVRREVVQQVEDPIITMFKRTKRNVDFKISVDISDKIPRLDFIEMMEDSYEISMIDFLADEFTNKILQDPSLIRESVKNKIKQLVYGGEITKSEPKVNDQITDSVTQVNPPTPPADRIVKEGELPTKPKTTRKPRAKKESTEK
jgi:hypothetical protein